MLDPLVVQSVEGEIIKLVNIYQGIESSKLLAKLTLQFPFLANDVLRSAIEYLIRSEAILSLSIYQDNKKLNQFLLPKNIRMEIV